MNPIVLYFHHVGAGIDHYTSVTHDTFQRMMDAVQQAGEVIDLVDALSKPTGDRRRFVLTFDDGYADLFGEVTEGLRERGVSATFFVVPSWVGARAPHPWAPVGLVCADPATLRDAQTQGFRVASHTWSHARLDRSTPAEVAAEVARAAEWLSAEGLGAELDGVLAYPYGRTPESPLSGLRAAFGTGRREMACWRCRPHDISRRYLAANDEQNWKETIDEWFRDAEHARDQCDHPDYR